MGPYDKKLYIEYMTRIFSQNAHINCSICSECGGACCKRGGCGLMTCDVPEMSIDGISRMLDTGKYSIGFFCTVDDGIAFPVPIMIAREIGTGKINNSILRKPCSLHTEKGCTLSPEERPTMGLLFVPRTNGNCEMLVDAMELLSDWFPHRKILEAVVVQETGKSSMELFHQGCIEAAMEIRQKLDMNLELNQNETQALDILMATGEIAIVFE